MYSKINLYRKVQNVSVSQILQIILHKIFNPLQIFHNFTKYESGEIILTKLNHL